MMHIHYNETTGNIIAWGDGEGSEPYLPGHAVIEIEKQDIDHKRHKVDPVTREVVDKTQDDLMAMLRSDVVRAIEGELVFTDHFVDPPSDRPRKGPFAFDWKPYRKELRDLSKLPDARAMIAAWPFRPDGIDAAVQLRKRAGSRGVKI